MADRFDDLRLRDFGFFERLASLGSLGATARELHLPKATATRWLQQLEERVGEPLVKRTTRSISLTEAGLRFAGHAREVLQVGRAARLGMSSSAAGGTLRVSVPVPMGRVLAGPIIAGFRKRLPDVRLEIKLSADQVDLVRDGFDLVLRGGPLPDSELKARRLSTATMWVYASARFRHDDPQRIPFIAAPGDEALLRRTKALAGIRPAVIVDDRTAIVDSLTWGAGFGLLPTFLGEAPRAEGSLVRLVKEPVAALPVHALYHPSQKDDPRLQILIEAFATQLARVM
ncbi:MAG: LysR family transcriptional regulator [Archangiaceae bacterium]|nr:LysR family transcriptional regulator [Archangiaceae bacterium]